MHILYPLFNLFTNFPVQVLIPNTFLILQIPSQHLLQRSLPVTVSNTKAQYMIPIK